MLKRFGVISAGMLVMLTGLFLPTSKLGILLGVLSVMIFSLLYTLSQESDGN